MAEGAWARCARAARLRQTDRTDSSLRRQVESLIVVVGHRSRGRLSRWWAGRENPSLLDRVSCSILVAIGSEAQEVQAAGD
jgi:hypothetical protein